MWWWRRRKGKRAQYAGLEFTEVGDTTAPRAWVARGRSGPLSWEARIERESDRVGWDLSVRGTLTGTQAASGTAADAYSGQDHCRAALRKIIDGHNEFADIA
ncbi:MAG: hypothetical protein KAI97_05830 [Gemmatimonadetes bacterium]|nr:hypothetical protein [Gemmatimonadota bacterium]